MISALSLPLIACGGDDPVATIRDVDPAGLWSFGVLVTVATGVCQGEQGDFWSHPITITKTGSSAPYEVTASGFVGSPNAVLTGTFDANNRLVISGSYPEDDGTTFPTHDLVATMPNRMEGTESWNWVGPGGECPGSSSSVVATRIQ